MIYDEALELLKSYGFYSFEKYSGLSIVGSRAAGVAREDSDWDVILFGHKDVTLRKPKLDLMFEDPPNDPNWYSRDLSFHATKYSVWIIGEQNWDENLLDWDTAIQRKSRYVTRQCELMGKHGSYLSSSLLKKYIKDIMSEARRLTCLKNRIHIPPTKMLEVYDPDPIIEPFREKLAV